MHCAGRYSDEKSAFCDTNYGIPKRAALMSYKGYLRILVRKSLLTNSSSMTTLLNLINFYLRCFFAPFSGAYQHVPVVSRAQVAIKSIAFIGWIPAHPIHAPTPDPLA